MANNELANQKLAWLKHYVDRYNMKYSPSNLTLYDTLSNYFKESGIVKMLAFWKEDTATAITIEQQTWIHETKHPIDVFKELELNNVVSSPLASPKLEYWISYKNRYNTRNPKRSTSLLLTLDHWYGKNGLDDIVSAGKQTATVSEQQAAERLKWLTQKKDPETAFSSYLKMEFDEKEAILLANTELANWVKYMELFNKEISKDQITLQKPFDIIIWRRYFGKDYCKWKKGREYIKYGHRAALAKPKDSSYQNCGAVGD
ncbi:unnamed protein product [Peronospora belbahrii]|uniref:Uncharacterized protein n=1 Tax=Peronospora belbahrii TaxID=622444 RepID=A0AAU9L9C2_9STRA|nr:unnamed protein product [Peronospora belbahrii]